MPGKLKNKIPWLSMPGKLKNKIPWLSRFSRTRTNLVTVIKKLSSSWWTSDILESKHPIKHKLNHSSRMVKLLFDGMFALQCSVSSRIFKGVFSSFQSVRFNGGTERFFAINCLILNVWVNCEMVYSTWHFTGEIIR